MLIMNKKELQCDMKELIPIQKIENGKIILKNQKTISVFKIEPTNFKLKTLLEQEAILEGYKLFLKRCNFDMQIIVQTRKRELADYIKNLKNVTKGNDDIRDMLNDYISFLYEVISDKKIVSKSFYILVEINNLNEEDLLMKITESLKMCDNEVKKCDDFEVVGIIKNYLNREVL